MEKIRTKEAAESLLRELPSVIGAFVREDIFGHPREVHLLVRPGPNVKHLARDVRDLLEERLRVPVDQRVISIAQLETDPSAPELAADEEESGAAASPQEEDEGSAVARRLLFEGIEAMMRDARVVVRVRLGHRGEEHTGEGAELDAGNGRVRAAATATLRAATSATRDLLRFDLDSASVVRAFGREYALVAVLAVSRSVGRRPITLVGAQPIEGDEASAAALATLKAVNRTAGLQLRSLAD